MTLRNSFQVDDVNLQSRSETMSRGSPGSFHISFANLRARSAAVLALSFRGMKWAILVNLSITTHSSVQPCFLGYGDGAGTRGSTVILPS